MSKLPDDEAKTSGPEVKVVSRRGLLELLTGAGAGALAATLAGGGIAAAAGELAAPSTKRKFSYGMVIDTRRCVGCKSCVVACKAENKTPPGVNYMLVTSNAFGARPDDRPLFTAKPCYHCDEPPCVGVCPVSATFKRAQDGIVAVDYDRCIGCRYCQTACPYGARYFDFGESYPAVVGGALYESKVRSPEYGQFRQRTEGKSPIGNVRKCTYCVHLQDAQGRYDKAAGRWPACAKTCTGKAIQFGDLGDPGTEVSRLLRERQSVRLKEDLGTGPSVHYLL
jgi:molybdopterin-containing oxidoreductase family iron-sulfur binding subunit